MAVTTPASTTTRKPRALLATERLLPDGEPGGEALIVALDAVGVDAAWVAWDDAAVDWACDVVVVRSTWDYSLRPAEFLDWSREVERVAPLLNGSDAFAWNVDKAYLLDLAERVPVVPTVLLAADTLTPQVSEGLERHRSVVIKPRTGAGGEGLLVVDSPDDPRLADLGPGRWILQPLVESIRSTGETSVFVLGGGAVSQVDKRPGPGTDVRVHEEYGGHSVAVPLAEDTAIAAEAACRAVGDILGRAPSYARVDLVVLDGVWTVGEVELVEPGLYLDVVPENAEHLARLVASELAR